MAAQQNFISILVLLICGYKVFGIPTMSSTVSPIVETICDRESKQKQQSDFYNNGTQECADKSGFTMEQLSKIDFTVAGFDDKCFTKCVMVDAGFLAEDGEPLTENMISIIKSLFPSQYHEQLITSFNGCITESEKQVESKGGRKAALCEFGLFFAQCLDKEEVKFCKSIKKEK